jgi:polar amino acid transport system substrate-binding protein
MYDSPSVAALKELAPYGVIRAAINLSNPTLAQGTPESLRGVTVDLARELGRRLELPVELVSFYAAGKVSDAIKDGICDVAFMALDHSRTEEFAFTSPYMAIEGAYLVRTDSPLNSFADVDRRGIRIASNQGAAYTAYLSRTLVHAELVTAVDAFSTFREAHLDGVAGIRQALAKYTNANADVKLLPGRFMEIQQAIATGRERCAAADYLNRFIEDAKQSGFVRETLSRNGQSDTVLAP